MATHANLTSLFSGCVRTYTARAVCLSPHQTANPSPTFFPLTPATPKPRLRSKKVATIGMLIVAESTRYLCVMTAVSPDRESVGGWVGGVGVGGAGVIGHGETSPHQPLPAPSQEELKHVIEKHGGKLQGSINGVRCVVARWGGVVGRH